MKLKRCMAIFLIFTFLMLQLNFIQFVNVSKAQETQTFNFELEADSYEVTKGETVTITASAKDLANMSSGIIAIGGQLEFDKDVLEIDTDSIKGINSWRFSKGYYNLNNFKFITDSDEIVSEDSDVFEITFKVKEDTTVENTQINLKSVAAGTGALINGIAHSQDSSITINIVEEKEPDDITSEVYNINKENGTISEIEAETTIATFKSNVTANAPIVFLDKDGNVIEDDSVILENGMKIKVGETLEFSIEVKEKPIVEDITSNVYNINKENGTISEIEADTTIAVFKSNVETNATLVFLDKDGNEVEDDSVVLENGMKVKVGTTYEFSLIVKEKPVVVENITSNVYNINKENNTISEIDADTTIAVFKSNVETNATLVFLDKDGNEVEDDSVVLENGMKVKVGTTYEFSLIVKEKPVVEDITSEVYDIDKTNNIISETSVNTTIAAFKSNVETNTTLVFLDKNGNVVENEDELVKTGMKVKVGTTYEFNIVVKGDADGDGKLSVNDIALMKLHYIEKEGYTLTGLYLKAVDTDKDEKISVNDVAQIKLLYIKSK